MSGYTNPPPMTMDDSGSDEEEPHASGTAHAGYSISPAVNNADFTNLFNTCCGAITLCFAESVAFCSGCFSCCAECLKCGCGP